MRILLFGLLLVLGVATPARAEWRKAVSPSFIVYGDMKEAELLAFTQRVERFDTVLRRRFKIGGDSAPVRLTIFLVGGGIDVGKLKGTPGRSIKGFYTIGPNGPMAVSQRTRASSQFEVDADTVLFHEYTHHFMFQYFPAPYPDWFVEGFAEFYLTARFDREGRAELGKPAYHRGYSLAVGEQLPAATMLTARISDLKEAQIASLYARGWILFHYLQFAPERAGQFEKYVLAINKNVAPREAGEQAFGDLAKLDKDLAAYQNARRIKFVGELNPTPVPAGIQVTTLDAAESAVVMDRLNMMQGMNDEQRGQALASLSAKRATFPKSAPVAALLAQVHYEAEDYDSAKSAADAALALDPANAHAQLYKGMAEMRVLLKNDIVDPARWKAARAQLVKANRANPEDPYPLYHYYRSCRDQGIRVPPIASEGLAKALTLLPADPRMRFDFINYLIAEKRYPAALSHARLLLLAPHGQGDNPSTRTMIRDLEYAVTNNGRFDVHPNLLPVRDRVLLLNA